MSRLVYIGKDGSETEIVTMEGLKTLLAQYGLKPTQESLSGEGEAKFLELMPQSINPALILQDSSHRFVNDKQIELWRSKPTLHEIRDLIAETKDGLETSINDVYYRLLNMPDAIRRIKKLSRILQNDEVLSELFKLFDDTISVEDLEQHKTSNAHITNVDRKNLQLLQKMIDDGIIETIEKMDSQQIAEQAEVDKNIDERFDRHIPWFFLVGCEGQCDPEECDLYFESKSKDQQKAQHLIFDNLKFRLQFTGGNFFCDHFKFDSGNGNVVSGIGNDTEILVKNSVYTREVTIRDMMIYNTSTDKLVCKIGDDSRFDNVTFSNCRFILSGCTISFTNCVFINCKWESLSGRNIMITNNFFRNTKEPHFICASLICNNNLS